MTLTVKDFAKTLKIKDDALLERMKLAGLSHSKPSDKITPEDKLAILKSLKARKNTSSKSSDFLFFCFNLFNKLRILLINLLSKNFFNIASKELVNIT